MGTAEQSFPLLIFARFAVPCRARVGMYSAAHAGEPARVVWSADRRRLR